MLRRLSKQGVGEYRLIMPRMKAVPYAIPHLRDLDRLLPATRTTRPDIARAHLAAIFAEHDLRLTSGRVDFSHQQAALCDASIGILRYGAEVEVVAPALDFYVCQLTLDGEVAFRTGRFDRVLRPGTLFVMNPGISYRKRWSRDAQQLMIKIPRRRLEAHAMRGASGAALRPIVFSHEPVLLDDSRAAFVDLIAYVCRDLASPHGLSGRSELRRDMEDMLLSALLATQGRHSALDEIDHGTGEMPGYLRRAEHHLRTHLGRAIPLDELTAMAGVSERTLQQAFRRYRGQSPMEFSRDLRLDLARDAILTRPDTGVTAIALEFGFNHLGRFAQVYGARFGERPSETVKRRMRH